MVDISNRLNNTDVININSRVASVKDVLSSSTNTDKTKVFSFFDTEQIVKPLSNKEILENNTKKLDNESTESLKLISKRVDYSIETDEDLEKAFIDINNELKESKRVISFDSFFTSKDMQDSIPSLSDKTDISYFAMSKENLDNHLKIKNNNDYIRNLLYSESITTSNDYNFNSLDQYKVDINDIDKSNNSFFDSMRDKLTFYSADTETMEHFKNVSLDSVNKLKDTYSNTIKHVSSTCDNLVSIFSGTILDINRLIKGFNDLMNMSLGFNNPSLLNDLMNCFELTSDALNDAKTITNVGKSVAGNGSFSLVDGILEKSSKAKLNFPSLVSKTFSNAKKSSNYVIDEARDSYIDIKATYGIDDSNELKRTLRTTKLKSPSILEEEDVFDIHKIQKDRDLSSFILADDIVDLDGDFTLMKNQPLKMFL